MVTYWLNGESEKKAALHLLQEERSCKLPSTPIPINVRKQMANNGKALNDIHYQDHNNDETEVPLLSITTPSDFNATA